MMRIAGCILAGGRSNRMGQDKANVLLNGKTLLQHAIDKLAPQVGLLAVNANHHLTTDLPIIRDSIEGFAGPLAGILAALEWTAQQPGEPTALVTVPVDAPFFPDDLVARLAAEGGDQIIVAQSSGQIHPVFALWPIKTADTLRGWLRDDQNRSAKCFLASVPHKVVDFPVAHGFDPFMNVNTPLELELAEKLLHRS